MKSVLNGRTVKYHSEKGRFRMIPHPYKYSHGLCLNDFPHVWLINNQRDQVSLFRYIHQDDKVYHLVRGSKVLGDMY